MSAGAFNLADLTFPPIEPCEPEFVVLYDSEHGGEVGVVRFGECEVAVDGRKPGDGVWVNLGWMPGGSVRMRVFDSREAAIADSGWEG